MEKKQERREKGITLVALVITIIVLIILAGVTITMLIDENGIVTRAQRAKNEIEEAQKREENILSQTEFYMAGEAEVGKIVEGSNKTINGKAYSYRNPVIPEGFAAIETEDATWKLDSEGNPSGWNKGLVISDAVDNNGNSIGNEFVWIAVDNENVSYDRIVWSKDGWEYSQSSLGIDTETNSLKIIRDPSIQGYYCVEKLSDEEKNSVNKYGGFYIGRYESGVKNYTDIDIDEFDAAYSFAPNNEWTAFIDGEISIREGETIWTLITLKEAEKKAEQLYSLSSSVSSKLVSSYAWDTALQFISQEDENFPTDSNDKGNYNDDEWTNVEAFKTGRYKVCNIFDMAGNAQEYTTEEIKGEGRFGVRRGGSLCPWSNGTIEPAAFAGYGYVTNNAENAMGFRVTLYIK